MRESLSNKDSKWKVALGHPRGRTQVDVCVNVSYLTAMADDLGRPNRTYTISSLSREFGITPRALRFYEDRGLISPARVGQMRIYSARDRARLRLILLGKRIGFELGEIKELLDLYELGDGQRTQWRATLDRLRARAPMLEAQREDIDSALEIIRDGIRVIEARLEASAGDPFTDPKYELGALRRLDEPS